MKEEGLKMKKILVLVMAAIMVLTLAACGGQGNEPAGEGGEARDLRFVIVPKVVHEWFDAVTSGAEVQAAILSDKLGVTVEIDFRAPATADVGEQNRILEQAAATMPDGIALDPLDWDANRAIVEEIIEKGVPVIFFDSRVPGSGIFAIGADHATQARMNAEKMVELLGPEGGQVAIQHGVVTAANHSVRYQTLLDTFAEHPQIEVIEAPPGEDDIAISQTGAAAVIAANPDLRGFMNVDAAAPVGQALAVEEAGRAGEIIIVGAENMVQIYEFIESGTIIGGYSVPAVMFGELLVTMLFHMQQTGSGTIPVEIDTGLTWIDQYNVQTFIEIAEALD